MIPLGDASRRLQHFPLVTLLIIGANALMFLQELQYGDSFINHWALIPSHIWHGRDLITIFTAMFMHAGWLHIISNMLFLWAFGPALEDVMGPVSYLFFYLLGGVAATVAQVYVMPGSNVPNLGASGAIAGVMGGFLMTYPGDRIRTVLFLGFFFTITMIPAILLIGLWFLLQVLSSFGPFAQVQQSGIAYMAHIGGFIFGLIFARMFESASLRGRQGLA